MNRSLSASRFAARAHSFSGLAAAIGAVVLLSTAGSSTANAQTTSYTSAPPQIVVSANGEVVSSPDRANIQLGVETEAKTAALASAENNKKQNAVLAAIKALGIPASAITTSSFTVSPIQRYDDKLRKTLIDGYRVSNLVVVNVAKIEQTGAVIDGALADPSKAREEAISKAVTQSRREAEVAAKAAGGSINGLLEITVSSYDQPRPVPMFAMAKMSSAAEATPVSEGTLTVQVSVTTRWRFAP